MSTILPYLALQNWKNLRFDQYEKDFTFIINEKQCITTSRFVADVLSPVIAKLHQLDASIDFFAINSEYKGDFRKIINLVNISQVAISEIDELNFYVDALVQLGNDSIIQEYFSQKDEGVINIDNVLDRIKLKKAMKSSFSIQDELDFIAKHLVEIQNKDEFLKKLDLNMISSIFSNKNLQIEDESWLLHFIINMVNEVDKSYSVLFEYVEFSSLDFCDIDIFMDFFDFSSINHGIWNSICNFIRKQAQVSQDIKSKKSNVVVLKQNKSNLNKNTSNANQNRANINIFENNNEIEQIENDQQFEIINLNQLTGEGILSFLTRQNHNRNIFTVNNIVELRSSSLDWGNLSSLLDLGSPSFFGTNNSVNQWVYIDFKEKFIIPSHYSIKSTNFNAGETHLRSWVIECSVDGNEWTEIDRKENNSELNQRNISKTFEIAEPTLSKYFRIRQIGPNWRGDHYLSIASIEIYGDLLIPHTN